MKEVNRFGRSLILLGLGFVVLVFALSSNRSTLAAPSGGGGLDIAWSTVDGGGDTSMVGGTYSLGGTIGQADTRVMQGGTFVLAGGFWPNEMTALKSFMPLIHK